MIRQNYQIWYIACLRWERSSSEFPFFAFLQHVCATGFYSGPSSSLYGCFMCFFTHNAKKDYMSHHCYTDNTSIILLHKSFSIDNNKAEVSLIWSYWALCVKDCCLFDCSTYEEQVKITVEPCAIENNLLNKIISAPLWCWQYLTFAKPHIPVSVRINYNWFTVLLLDL